MGTLGSHGGDGKPGKSIWAAETTEPLWRLTREEEQWTMAGEGAERVLGLAQWEKHWLWEQEPLTTCDLRLLHLPGLHFFTIMQGCCKHRRNIHKALSTGPGTSQAHSKRGSSGDGVVTVITLAWWWGEGEEGEREEGCNTENNTAWRTEECKPITIVSKALVMVKYAKTLAFPLPLF